jgi:inhibitor of cysteine peptidase
MNKYTCLAAVAALLIACVTFAGCTGTDTVKTTTPSTAPTEVATAAATEVPTAAPSAAPTATGKDTPALSLTKDDNGSENTVSKGEIVKITLAENPTTGYTWQLDTTGFEVVSDEYVPPNTDLVGAGGEHVWELKAVNTGTYKLNGIYKRSWEQQTADDTTWSATVTVTKATLPAKESDVEPALSLTKDDNGSENTVSKGDVVKITLAENPTTGYTWQLDTTGFEVVSDEYVPPNTTLVGAGGEHVWELKAVNTGTYKLNGIYKRSWEQQTADDTTWSATVIVK